MVNFWCAFSVYKTTTKELDSLFLELNAHILSHVEDREKFTGLLQRMTELTFQKKKLIEQMRVTLRENLALLL
jgi:hypothetical protein